MRRTLLAIVIVLAAASLTIAFMDGLRFRSEVEYHDPDLKLGEPITVNVQNIRQSGWGGSLLGSSTYGPPFDLYILGTLPQNTPVTSIEVRDLSVRDSQGAPLLSVALASLPLSDGETIQAGVITPNKSFAYQVNGFTSTTPTALTVTLELVLGGPVPLHIPLTKRFHLRCIRRLSLGSHDWNF